MIFDNNTKTVSENAVDISNFPYEANLEGAMMCVYENECNYNALMKAVGISELRYYSETGKDLFINEAEALKGFFNKVKGFFEAAIKKIQQLVQKAMEKITAFVANDANFVKKFGKVLKAKDLTGFEAPEHDSFTGLDEFNADDPTGETDYNINAYRGTFVGEAECEAGEFVEKLKKKIYGDKTKDFNIDELLSHIENAKKDVAGLKNSRDKAVAVINAEIKFVKSKDKKDLNQEEIGKLNDEIAFFKETTKVITLATGVVIKAYQDRNRQASAICKKALAYKDTEKKDATSESSIAQLFAGVTIL